MTMDMTKGMSMHISTLQKIKALIVIQADKHSKEYNSGYVKGYNDGWDDAQKGIQDPKC